MYVFRMSVRNPLFAVVRAYQFQEGFCTGACGAGQRAGLRYRRFANAADAIRYALVRWQALCRYLDDGRVELDTNTVKRAIRPIALGRKNHLFAGSDGGADRWAIVCSLITTAKLNNVEPYAYLKDVLERMAQGHPMGRLDDLLPWNWTPSAV